MTIESIVFSLTPLTIVPVNPISWTLLVEVRERLRMVHSAGGSVQPQIVCSNCGRANESAIYWLEK